MSERTWATFFFFDRGPRPFYPIPTLMVIWCLRRQKQRLFDSVVLAIQTLGNVELLRRLRLLAGS